MPTPGRRTIEPVWYVGRMMGETVARTIATNPTKYDPGVWYNSAKFFDIEYQTYGNVGNELGENENFFFWKHSGEEKFLKFLFNRETNLLLGINAFGIRLRHEVCDRWISEGRDIGYVMQHLHEANFDSEFCNNYEPEILESFNRSGVLTEDITSARRRKLFGLVNI